MNRIAVALSVVLLAGLLSPAPLAVAQDEPPADEAELFASDNMTHVANLPYDNPYPDSTTLPYGTDVEFAQLAIGGAIDVVRLGGPGRVTTAVEVSKDAFKTADTVLVATGGVFADALAAAPLAASLEAPVLLSTADVLSPETAEEIQRLAANRVILLGGVDALAEQVVTDIEALDVAVERMGGSNRFVTAGVWVLDMTDLADAAQNPLSSPIDTLGFAYFDNSDTWSFKTNRFEEDGSFYGYANDIIRGLDVFRFDASAEAGDVDMEGRFVNQPTAIAIADQIAISNGIAPGELITPRCMMASQEI